MVKISANQASQKFLQYYELASTGEPVEISEQGQPSVYLVPQEMLIVKPERPTKSSTSTAWGALRGSVTYLSEDFDEPLGDSMWSKACRVSNESHGSRLATT